MNEVYNASFSSWTQAFWRPDSLTAWRPAC